MIFDPTTSRQNGTVEGTPRRPVQVRYGALLRFSRGNVLISNEGIKIFGSPVPERRFVFR